MCFIKAVLAFLVILCVALSGCGGDGIDGTSPTPGPNAMEFLGQTDHGCVASRGGVLECLDEASLTGVEASGDTVALWIRFEANCCPEFTEHVSYEAGLLNIAVVDTLYACRCICPFENAFTFLCDGSGQVHLLFESRATRGEDICISGLDTTVTIP